MLKKVTIKDGFVYKIYLKPTLLDAKKNIIKRIEQINSFNFNKYTSLVQTEIIDEHNRYIYKQKYFKPLKKSLFTKDDFLELVYSLNYLSSINFIHGDINRKNIIYTANGFKIIDYEPSLYQVKSNMPMPMITIPYVLKSDLDNKIITISTDKIGFFYFILRINNAFASANVVELSKDLNHSIFNVRDIDKMSYIEILHIAYLNIK